MTAAGPGLKRSAVKLRKRSSQLRGLPGCNNMLLRNARNSSEMPNAGRKCPKRTAKNGALWSEPCPPFPHYLQASA